ncbi:putative ripening-related protein 2 [Tanacetum coccineum]
MKKVSIRGNSSIKTLQTNVSTSSNGTFSLSNTFEVLNADNSVAEDVDSGDRIVMSSVQEERQSSTPFVEKINLVEQQLLEGNCVLLVHEDFASNTSGGWSMVLIGLLESTKGTYGDVDHVWKGKNETLGKHVQYLDHSTEAETYTTYRRSLLAMGKTRATMTINSFEKGGDGGGASECDEQYHSNNQRIVALSTKWYDNGHSLGGLQVSKVMGRDCTYCQTLDAIHYNDAIGPIDLWRLKADDGIKNAKGDGG